MSMSRKKATIELLKLLEKKCRQDSRMPAVVMAGVFKETRRDLEKE